MSLPELSRLVNFEQLPQGLQFKEGANLFNQVFYKNHIANGNKSGSVQAHLITIVSETELSIDIAGALGMKIIFLPGASTTTTSELNLSLHFAWKLKDLVQINSISSFEFNSNGFINLFQSLYTFSSTELLQNLLISDKINNTSPLDALIQDINTNHSPTPLISKYSGASPDVFEDFLIQLEASGLDLTTIVFSDYILNSNLETTIQNLKDVFSDTVNLSKDKLFDFLLPKISFSILQLPVAIEFPDTIFKPVDASNNPIPNAKARLTFNVGSLSWSSVTGFEFQGEYGFSFTKQKKRQLIEYYLKIILQAYLKNIESLEFVKLQENKNFIGKYKLKFYNDEQEYAFNFNFNNMVELEFIGAIPLQHSIFVDIHKKFHKKKYNMNFDFTLKRKLDFNYLVNHGEKENFIENIKK